MGFVFVSHAAPDKVQRVKPLVQALAREGVSLWLDRPGVGTDHFGFDDAFIRRHGIRGLEAGEQWDDRLLEALRQCDAVLVCLSKAAVEPGRQVLGQEILIGGARDNLVACIVDDLNLEDLPGDLGLLDVARIQCERVDPLALGKALEWIDHNPGRNADQLPSDLRRAWEVVLKLLRALERAKKRGWLLSLASSPPFMAPTASPTMGRTA